MAPVEAQQIHLTSPLLQDAGFSHAFFTRKGGVSPAPFGSLSFSTKDGDSRENVARNLEIAAGVLGVRSSQVFFLSQVHGTESFVATGAEQRSDFAKQCGDAVVTKEPLAAAVRTADCVPVLLACPESGWVAAVHAGWRGCAAGIVPSTAERLKQSGATRLLAAIGPHISQDSFEVSPEVARELQDASPAKDIVDNSRERPHVDLRKMLTSQLRAIGLPAGQIDQVFGCSLKDEELFFSFRRDGTRSGRLLSAIVGGVPGV